MNEELQKLIDELKASVGEGNEYIKKYNDLKEELDKKSEKSEAEVKSLKEELEGYKKTAEEYEAKSKALDESYEVKSKELADRLDNLEVDKNRPGFGGGSGEIKSIGELFTDSEEYKSAIESGDLGFKKFETKTLTTAATSIGASINPFNRREPDIIKDPFEDRRIGELIPTTNLTGGDTVYYLKRTGFYPLKTELTVQSVPGDGNITVASVAGMTADQVLTLREGADSQEVTIQSIDTTTKVVTLTAVTTGAHTYTVAGSKVTSRVVSPVAEEALKPFADIVIEEESVAVKTLPVMLEITEQAFRDASQVSAAINNDMAIMLDESLEEQQLNGDGTGANINGILQDADIQTRLWSSGTAGDTRTDVIRRAINDLRTSKYRPGNVTANPDDLTNMELEKDDNGQFIMEGKYKDGKLWRVPVLETTNMPAGQMLIGDFRMGIEGYLRDGVTIKSTDSHEDNFSHNIITMRAEMRYCQAIKRPEAFCLVTFDAAPVAA